MSVLSYINDNSKVSPQNIFKFCSNDVLKVISMSLVNSIAREFGISAYADLKEFRKTAHTNKVSTLQIVYGSKHGNGCGYDVPFRTIVRIDTKDGNKIPSYYALKHEGCWPTVKDEDDLMERIIKGVKPKLSEFSFLGDIRDDSAKL